MLSNFSRRQGKVLFIIAAPHNRGALESRRRITERLSAYIEAGGGVAAVELWFTDRAVLPIQKSLGGIIHRNYDLLLRHRLQIVGEVQLPLPARPPSDKQVDAAQRILG